MRGESSPGERDSRLYDLSLQEDPEKYAHDFLIDSMHQFKKLSSRGGQPKGRNRLPSIPIPQTDPAERLSVAAANNRIYAYILDSPSLWQEFGQRQLWWPSMDMYDIEDSIVVHSRLFRFNLDFALACHTLIEPPRTVKDMRPELWVGGRFINSITLPSLAKADKAFFYGNQ